MKEKDPKELWGKAKNTTEKLEAQIVETYIAFLREAALYYLRKGRRG